MAGNMPKEEAMLNYVEELQKVLCVCARVCACMCACVCACMCACVCACVYVCVEGENLLYQPLQIVETMPQSKEVEDFLQSIGSFYEEVEEATQPNTDTTKNEPTNSPAVTGTGVETTADEAKEKKELESDSEEEIFSDPVATPESLSVSAVQKPPLLFITLYNFMCVVQPVIFTEQCYANIFKGPWLSKLQRLSVLAECP